MEWFSRLSREIIRRLALFAKKYPNLDIILIGLGTIFLLVGVVNAFLVGFSLLSERYVIPWFVTSLLANFLGVLFMVIKRASN